MTCVCLTPLTGRSDLYISNAGVDAVGNKKHQIILVPPFVCFPALFCVHLCPITKSLVVSPLLSPSILLFCFAPVLLHSPVPPARRVFTAFGSWFLMFFQFFSGLFFVSHLFRMFLLFCYLPLLAKVFFMLIELALRSNHLPSCSYGHGLDATTFLRSDCLFENNNGRSSRCKQSCC